MGRFAVKGPICLCVQEAEGCEAGAQGAAFAAAWNAALEAALCDAELLQALRRLLDKGDPRCHAQSLILSLSGNLWHGPSTLILFLYMQMVLLPQSQPASCHACQPLEDSSERWTRARNGCACAQAWPRQATWRMWRWRPSSPPARPLCLPRRPCALPSRPARTRRTLPWALNTLPACVKAFQ